MLMCKQCGVNPAISQGYSFAGGGSSLCQDCINTPKETTKSNDAITEKQFFTDDKFLVVGFKVDQTLYLSKDGKWVEKDAACLFSSKEEARTAMLTSSGITNGLIIKDTNEIKIRWEKK